GRTRLARTRHRGGGSLGAAREAEAMHLADHGVTRDAAELGGDLACRKALPPQLLQKLDPIVGPSLHLGPLLVQKRHWPLLHFQFVVDASAESGSFVRRPHGSRTHAPELAQELSGLST